MTSPTAPTDSSGNVLYGNPDRIRAISAELSNANERLWPQIQELRDCVAFWRAGLAGDGGYFVTLDEADGDIRAMISNARPTITADATSSADQGITAIRDAAVATLRSARSTAHVAEDLSNADATYRDVLAHVPATVMPGVLYGSLRRSGTLFAPGEFESARLDNRAIDRFESANFAINNSAREGEHIDAAFGTPGASVDSSYFHTDLAHFFAGLAAQGSNPAPPTPTSPQADGFAPLVATSAPDGAPTELDLIAGRLFAVQAFQHAPGQ